MAINVHGFPVRTPICHIVPVSRAYTPPPTPHQISGGFCVSMFSLLSRLCFIFFCPSFPILPLSRLYLKPESYTPSEVAGILKLFNLWALRKVGGSGGRMCLGKCSSYLSPSPHHQPVLRSSDEEESNN